MSTVNWKPFVFGGLASITAECGEWVRDGGGRAACVGVFFFFLPALGLKTR